MRPPDVFRVALTEIVPPTDEAIGQKLGRYKLLERVGEGGCGVVYVAEQTEPARRGVALKVIKLGMDTKQVVARFEAERQALVMMNHPTIAKVLDAGTAEGAEVRSQSERHQLQSPDVLEVFTIEGRKSAATMTRGGCDNQVVVARHLPGCLGLSPDASVFPGDFIGVRNHGEEPERCFQISLAWLAMLGVSPLHSMPQLGDRYRGDFDFFARLGSEPSAKIKSALLAPDDDIRIEDHCHWSSGALNAARDLRMSLAQARASSGESSTWAKQRASSAPVHRGAEAGTSRATGTAASRTTKVVFSRRARATHSASPAPAPSSAMFVSFIGQPYRRHGHRAKPNSLTS